jgi:hypothetical protein
MSPVALFPLGGGLSPSHLDRPPRLRLSVPGDESKLGAGDAWFSRQESGTYLKFNNCSSSLIELYESDKLPFKPTELRGEENSVGLAAGLLDIELEAQGHLTLFLRTNPNLFPPTFCMQPRTIGESWLKQLIYVGEELQKALFGMCRGLAITEIRKGIWICVGLLWGD